MKVSINSPDLSVLANVMNSHCHMEGIRTTVERELKQHGFYGQCEVKVDVNYRNDGITARATVKGNEHYDQLMKCKHTGVDVDEITASWSKLILALPQNIETRIYISVSCDTPENDVLTLRQLGKVRTQASHPVVYESVICDI